MASKRIGLGVGSLASCRRMNKAKLRGDWGRVFQVNGTAWRTSKDPEARESMGLWGEDSGWGRLWETQGSGGEPAAGWPHKPSQQELRKADFTTRGGGSFRFATFKHIDFDSFDIEKYIKKKTKSASNPTTQTVPDAILKIRTRCT